eukprot:m.108498 g.108498  ORF g.108498 m.108498 type:complete len:374 (-) comp19095_c0_seq2:42-1163(-)
MDESVQKFVGITGASAERARFFLEAAGGDENQALEAFFSSGDTGADGMDQDLASPPPTTASAAPAPATAAAKAAAAAPARERPRVATLGDFSSSQPDNDDDNEYYAGGKQSGVAVQGGDGKKKTPDTKHIFESARKHGAVEHFDDEDEQQTPAFQGLGYRLGESSTAPSMAVGSSLSARQKKPEMRKVVVSFWKNGFSVDTGDDSPVLRNMSDPRNTEFLSAIMSGQIPPELIALGGTIDLEMQDHRTEDFVAPKPRVKAFAGEGFTLGGSTSGAAAAAAAPPPAPLPAEGLKVDESKPVTKVQVRLADGTRLVARLNHTHTVGDLRSFVAAAKPAQPPFLLLTAHPSQELTDDTLTLEKAKLLNSVVIQKRV